MFIIFVLALFNILDIHWNNFSWELTMDNLLFPCNLKKCVLGLDSHTLRACLNQPRFSVFKFSFINPFLKTIFEEENKRKIVWQSN